MRTPSMQPPQRSAQVLPFDRNQWQADKKLSDRYQDEIRSILGKVLIAEPPLEEDQERNTDLIVLNMSPVRVACRVRDSHKYQALYGDEFTIRCSRPKGTKTELAKVIEGWGDYLFYGFGNGAKLTQWFIGDLKVFRLWFNRYLATHQGAMPGIRKQNRDGSSELIAFKIEQLPSEFVIRRWTNTQ